MNVRSLGFRLAVWYFCTVTAILSLAVTGYWFAVRAGLHAAMDRHLGYRVTGFQQYLEAAGADEEAEIASRLAALSRVGELYEAYDEAGALIAQSYTLSRHRTQPRPPLDLGSEIRFETGGPSTFPIRIAWQKATIGGRPFILGAADPLAKYRGGAHGVYVGLAPFRSRSSCSSQRCAPSGWAAARWFRSPASPTMRAPSPRAICPRDWPSPNRGTSFSSSPRRSTKCSSGLSSRSGERNSSRLTPRTSCARP